MTQKHNYHFASKGDEKNYELMCRLIQMPLAAQRVYYFGHSSYPNNFAALGVYEKPDTISIVQNRYSLKWGNNGFYISASKTAKLGITYHQKGPTASRLRIWGTSGVYEVESLVKVLLEKLNPSALFLLRSPIIRTFITYSLS